MAKLRRRIDLCIIYVHSNIDHWENATFREIVEFMIILFFYIYSLVLGTFFLPVEHVFSNSSLRHDLRLRACASQLLWGDLRME